MFDFRLLRSLPRPKWSVFFCVLSFCCLACLYWSKHAAMEKTATANDLGGALRNFLRVEQSEHPKRPQILIAGSSLSGMGFHVEELERRMGMSVAKISLSGGKTTEVLDILECYPNECQHANLIFLELAPARLTGGQNKERKRIFDEIRGVKHSASLVDTLKRSSMPYFVRHFFRAQHSKQPRKQPHKITNRHSPESVTTIGVYERQWDEREKNKKKTKPIRISLQQFAEQTRKNREDSISKTLPPMVKKAQYRNNHFKAVYRLLDLCKSRNVFVVVCVTPQWYGQLNFTQNDLEKPTQDEYLSLLQDLNRQPNCVVIVCRDFEEITDEGTDEDYLFDYGHMTRKGAILYTNWLADRLLETPKTAEAIRQRQMQKQIGEDEESLATTPSTQR